jgi:hypothetical protein
MLDAEFSGFLADHQLFSSPELTRCEVSEEILLSHKDERLILKLLIF